MSRRYFGINPTYVIVGIDVDGVEHFINSSCNNECWLTMFIRLISYRLKSSFRLRYVSLALKKLYL